MRDNCLYRNTTHFWVLHNGSAWVMKQLCCHWTFLNVTLDQILLLLSVLDHWNCGTEIASYTYSTKEPLQRWDPWNLVLKLIKQDVSDLGILSLSRWQSFSVLPEAWLSPKAEQSSFRKTGWGPRNFNLILAGKHSCNLEVVLICVAVFIFVCSILYSKDWLLNRSNWTYHYCPWLFKFSSWSHLVT